MESGSERESRDEGCFYLDTIPVEVLLQIFKYVDATDLLRRVSLVSKYFYNILSNEMTWKIKQEKRWGCTGERKYPPIDLYPDPPPTSPYAENFTTDSFPWSRACVKREEQIKLWSNNLTHSSVKSHIACIDSVHLFTKNDKLLLACGSRDRAMSIWDVEEVLKEKGSSSSGGARIKLLSRAHDGWIWDFCVMRDRLFSCSWDMSAKIWDLENDLKMVGEFRSNTPLLSISSTETLTAIGTFNRKTLLLDPRSPSKPVHSLTHHTRSVLSVGMDPNYLISCGEDGLVCKHDLRANKLQKSLKLALSPDNNRQPYPTCMSFRDTRISLPYFYVGDNTGTVHLIDILDFEVVASHKLHDRSPVRGVFHNLGSVMTCSKNGKLFVRDPTLGLRTISVVDVGDKIELPCVHSLNNVVACGGGDGNVRVWGEIGGVC